MTTARRRQCLTARWSVRGFAVFRWHDLNGQRWTMHVAPSEYVTGEQAAVLLSTHRTTVYDWMRDGTLPFVVYFSAPGRKGKPFRMIRLESVLSLAKNFAMVR